MRDILFEYYRSQGVMGFLSSLVRSLPTPPGLNRLTGGGSPLASLPKPPGLPSLPNLGALPNLPGLNLPGVNLLGGASPTGLARGLLEGIPGRELLNWTGLPSPVPSFLRAGSNAPTVGGNNVDRKSLALMADDVYNAKASPPPGFREATASDLNALKLKPSDLTSNNSTFAARVYVSGTGADAKYVVAFRGSQSKSDFIADVKQAFGGNTDHYQSALKIGRQIALSGNNNVTLTGHSLGGGLASATAIASGRDAVTFNAAGLSDATIKSANQIRTNVGVANAGKVDAYFVRGEILSAVQGGGDRLIGGLLGGPIGSILGDVPEAYGNRIGLDGVRPSEVKWYQDNPVSRHGMNWVINSLPK
jgi:Protein of unknown function (DUF2974)